MGKLFVVDTIGIVIFVYYVNWKLGSLVDGTKLN